jgi:excisionase family DNA binding protein
MFNEYKDFITTEELAEILRLNVKTIIKLAKEKKLPSMKIANQFRFSKEKLIAWMEAEMNNSSDKFLMDFEKSLTLENIQIHKMLTPSHLLRQVKSVNKIEAIKEIIETGKDVAVIKNMDALLNDIITREEIHTTAVGSEIAFPHPRSVTYNMINSPLLLMGISGQGIEFNAYDKKSVKIIIVVIIPQLSLHLQVLTRLSLIFRDETVKDKILSANSADQIIAAIKEKEEKIDSLEK